MTANEVMMSFLLENKWARLRKNKNKALAVLALAKHQVDIETNLLADIIVESTTLDREWRKILSDNPTLRGVDYESKDELEIEKQQELGYNV